METITLISSKKTFYWQQLWKKFPAKDFVIPAICFLFITLVAIHDTYLVVIEDHILKMEKNPICTYFIQLDPECFTCFILAKMTGLLAVILVLSLLHHARYTHATLVTTTVVLFQALLVMYLHLSDPKIGGLPNFLLLFEG